MGNESVVFKTGGPNFAMTKAFELTFGLERSVVYDNDGEYRVDVYVCEDDDDVEDFEQKIDFSPETTDDPAGCTTLEEYVEENDGLESDPRLLLLVRT